jgi:cytochrome c biogenesis protein CcmG/thiol:disulfide interchange protein DsbE
MKRLLSPLPIAVVCALAALLALLAYGLAANQPDSGLDEAVARGERPPAPALRLPELEGGGRGSLADHRGKVVVLNYWASWCDPCRSESPLLERWHKRMARDGGGTVLGVDVLDVDSDAREFIREYGLTYPMLRDKQGATQGDFGIVGYPETFVIDKRGRVAALRRGPVDDAWLRATVPPLLEESS